jgi:hypothetical protein
VVACKNRNLELPEKLEEAQESFTETGTRTQSVEVLSQTKSLK